MGEKTKEKKTQKFLPQHDRAGVLPGAPGKVHRPVVPDHYLLDEVARPQADAPGVVEGGGDLSSGGRGEAL